MTSFLDHEKTILSVNNALSFIHEASFIHTIDSHRLVFSRVRNDSVQEYCHLFACCLVVMKLSSYFPVPRHDLNSKNKICLMNLI